MEKRQRDQKSQNPVEETALTGCGDVEAILSLFGGRENVGSSGWVLTLRLLAWAEDGRAA